MGLLVNGIWQDQWYDTKSSNGAFVREDSKFHHQVVSSPQTEKEFEADKDRYHLFVSYACPWAHRALIFRKLKKLDNVIGVTVVEADMLENGWEFQKNDPSLGDLGLNYQYLYELYSETKPNYTGRVTVPVLWDKQTKQIVNNESSQIIRFFNSSFSKFSPVQYNFYPEELRAEIDKVNEDIYHNINNGVYKCGFATTQEAYESAFDNLFAALDRLESRLSKSRYLVGNRMTEADWRLFTTLVRFDHVYYTHFKANHKRIADYENLSQYLRDLYQFQNVRETTHLDHIKRHYFYSHTTINPFRIVPKGPSLSFESPHDRDKLGPQPIL